MNVTAAGQGQLPGQNLVKDVVQPAVSQQNDLTKKMLKTEMEMQARFLQKGQGSEAQTSAPPQEEGKGRVVDVYA